MPADLLIYALLAAGLIFWLRSILGTKNGEERDRSAPYLKSAEDKGNNVVALNGAPIDAKVSNPEGLIKELMENPKGNMAIESRSAELFLLDLARADRSFDVYKFLQAAQDAFVYIVESFGDGDRHTLKELLSPTVYDAFDASISARENRGHKMQTEISSIKKSEIIEGRFEGRKAYVTIRFFADETSVTRDANGEIISGHPEKVTVMRDVWTFARDLKSRDPRWLVVETREDGAEDNLTIPNTY